MSMRRMLVVFLQDVKVGHWLDKRVSSNERVYCRLLTQIISSVVTEYFRQKGVLQGDSWREYTLNYGTLHVCQDSNSVQSVVVMRSNWPSRLDSLRTSLGRRFLQMSAIWFLERRNWQYSPRGGQGCEKHSQSTFSMPVL